MSSDAAEGFVRQLYNVILLRSGNAVDVSAWADLLDAGSMTDAQVADAFAASPEATNFVLPIVRLYQVFLERAPDAAGLEGWVTAYRDGMSLDSIAVALAQSVEFKTIHAPDGSTTNFVDGLYQIGLGRAPDPAGSQYWIDYLNQHGNTPVAEATVALSFAQSAEFIGKSTDTDQAWLLAAAQTGIYDQGSSAGGDKIGAISVPPDYATIILRAPGTTDAGPQTAHVTGEFAGTTSWGDFVYPKVMGAQVGDSLVFGNSGIEAWAAETASASEVNVSSTVSLGNALDAAAAHAASNAPGALIPAATGLYDWFQWGGNTYVLEAINNGTAAAPHTALQPGDAIVELVGLVDISGTAGHTLVI